MVFPTNRLKIHVKRGYNLAIRNDRTSNAYVVIKNGDQERKAERVRGNANPEWNEELTFNLNNPHLPFQLFVYNKGRLSRDYKMGEAQFFINPFVDAVMRMPEGLRDGDIIETIDPDLRNCLADESQIVWKGGKLVQNMFIRLNNVRSGEVEIQLSMEYCWGLLKIHAIKGLNLAIRDVVRRRSDPYIVFKMGNEQVKTRAVRQNVNPLWNEELTLYVPDPPLPVRLYVYDEDTFSRDDKMGEAQLDITPVVDVLKEGLEGLSDGTSARTMRPNRQNQLAQRSEIVWKDGEVVQNMVLRLNNVESGVVELQLRLKPLTS